MNIPLFSAIFSIASTVSIGILMIVSVVTGNDNMIFMLGSVVAGLLFSLPTAWVVTKRLSGLGG